MTVSALALSDWLSPSRPDVLVCWHQRQPLMLQRLRQQVQQLCGVLLARPEPRWALCFDDSWQFTVGLLAALHAGKTPVIPGHCRPSLLQEQASAFDAVLTDCALPPFCPQLTLDAAAHTCCEPLPAIAPDARLVLFTSGSTGQPRQVTKPLVCLDTEIQWLAARWGERLQDCCVVASVSHQHLYGLTFRIMLPMALGLPFVSSQLLYSEQLSALPVDGPLAFISSPAFLRRLDFSLTPPGCRLIVSAGGVLSDETAAAVAARWQLAVDEIYGSSETGVLAWRSRTDTHPLWQPFDGVKFSRHGQQRWLVRSPLIAENDGLLLDDKLEFAVSGGFQLCGRHDRVVKIEDKRVSLSEIERRLLAIAGIADAVALPISRYGRRAIGVVLVLHNEQDSDRLAQLKPQWKRELQRWLEPVAMPRFWRVVRLIPHNSQSKRAWPQIEELFNVAS